MLDKETPWDFVTKGDSSSDPLRGQRGICDKRVFESA